MDRVKETLYWECVQKIYEAEKRALETLDESSLVYAIFTDNLFDDKCVHYYDSADEEHEAMHTAERGITNQYFQEYKIIKVPKDSIKWFNDFDKMNEDKFIGCFLSE